MSGANRQTFGGFNKQPKVAELRAQLAVRLAAAALRGEGALAPREDEKLDGYILRLFADAQQRKDWRRLLEILETSVQYPAFRGILHQSDNAALRAYLAARNLDEAGVWPSAVASYIQALKAGSLIVPADEIKQRIEAIRREHPEDYQRGSDHVSPPSTPPSR